MDFALSKPQQELRERAREAIDTVVRPVVATAPKGGKLDTAALRRLYQGLAPLGYVSSTIPREAGGAGLSLVDYGLLSQRKARELTGVARDTIRSHTAPRVKKTHRKNGRDTS